MLVLFRWSSKISCQCLGERVPFPVCWIGVTCWFSGVCNLLTGVDVLFDPPGASGL